MEKLLPHNLEKSQTNRGSPLILVNNILSMHINKYRHQRRIQRVMLSIQGQTLLQENTYQYVVIVAQTIAVHLHNESICRIACNNNFGFSTIAQCENPHTLINLFNILLRSFLILCNSLTVVCVGRGIVKREEI